MQIAKIITTINDNPTYRQFLPLCSMIWDKLFGLSLTVGYITTKSRDDDMVKALSKYGDIKLFSPISNIDECTQSRATRMYLASAQTDHHNCMIVDVDMLPLSVEVLSVFRHAPDDCLVQWGWDHPSFGIEAPDYGKWPMDRTAGSGKVFSEIVNPDNHEYEYLFKSWFNLHENDEQNTKMSEYDLNHFRGGCDESLLRAMYEEWPRRHTNTHRISRLELEPSMLCRRLDKSYPHMWHDLPAKLQRQEFIEVHGIRPLQENISHYADILDYFNIQKEDIIL